MLDQLRIQCPSCGIILDVKNSKHEALKQIVCPNCKKQLAVNFEEELEPAVPPQPIEPLYYGEMRIDLQEGINNIALPDCDKAEIKVLRLKDGNSKCMVRPLSDTIPVKVNRQQLQVDEQVVLSKGDYLEIGKTCLRAGESGTITPSTSVEPCNTEALTSPKPRRKKEQNYIWFYAALAFVALMGATILLWPKESPKPAVPDMAHINDSLSKEGTVREKKDSPIVKKDKGQNEGKESKKSEVVKEVSTSLSDYDLERLATKGDTEAQYVLGVKLIKLGGISNVVRGINYLKVAANNGSSKARSALGKAISSLQKQANQGDSISYYILKSI